MRTIERWNTVIRETYLKQFTPRIQKDLENITDVFPQQIENWYLTGKAGVGKTLYACLLLLAEQRNLYLANQIAECVFVSVPDLFLQLKATFNNTELEEVKIIQHYSSVHLLVLDDLGTVKCSDWAYQILYTIINNRYENMRKTIITSNLGLKELAQQLGDDRITSRIERMCKIVYKNPWNG